MSDAIMEKTENERFLAKVQTWTLVLISAMISVFASMAVGFLLIGGLNLRQESWEYFALSAFLTSLAAIAIFVALLRFTKTKIQP